jgi:hypothetical protein
MRYSTIEQAAAEATAGVEEIDAEIHRLMATRDMLATLADQLNGALPAIAEAFPAVAGNHVAALPDHPAAEHGYSGNGAPEDHAAYAHSSAAPASADPASPPEPSYAELVGQTKTFSLRNEGWPATSSVDQRGLRQLL